ncbi:MAG: CocE/NonD family hydrolase [Labilithrix sp.]|nr:CocE/NonD family hydrolase [Labilithrix sp.]
MSSRAVFACSAFAAACALLGACGEPRAPDRAHAGPLVKRAFEDESQVAVALREHYTKYEYRIPMRDGVHLYTLAYVPKDASRTYPIMLKRTPYGVAPYGPDNFPPKSSRVQGRIAPSVGFIREGYILVHQDVRGRLMSEGTFVDMRPHVPGKAKGQTDESSDAWDTIDFLVKNVPQNNGRVGAWGISYDGFYAAHAAIDAHPALKAVSPQAPVTECFIGDDVHHNGAFFLADNFGFYASFGKARPRLTRKMVWENTFTEDVSDAYDFFLSLGPIANIDAKLFKGEIPFWSEIMAHGDRDAWWQSRDPRPYFRDVKPAILTVGGWFDAEDLWGTLATYRAFEAQSSKEAENVLVMGPWSHGGWVRDKERQGDITFGQKTGAWYREAVELPFFERHLKNAAIAAPAEATIFETGTNTWQRYPTWPPPGAKRQPMYLHAGGRLSAAPPSPNEDAAGADAWISDPAKPVPYTARPLLEIDADYMTEDQRFAGRRPDVMVYATGDLTSDVTLAGPLEAALWVTTTGTDADFVVKLVDVYPQDHADPDPNPTGARLGGYQQLVRAEIMRGKYRNSFERPEPFKPGEPTLVKLAVSDTSHTFRTGHRIMVQIQSSWFPLVDRNPQTFTDIYKAKESDFRAATHHVLRTPAHPSSLAMTIVRGALP